MTTASATRRSTAELLRHWGSGWADGNDRVMLEGYDAGVSFRTTHSPSTGITHTVIANTSEGAWPMIRALDAHLFPA